MLHDGSPAPAGRVDGDLPEPRLNDAPQACPGGEIEEHDSAGGLQADGQGGGVGAVDDPPWCGHQVALSGRQLLLIQRPLVLG